MNDTDTTVRRSAVGVHDLSYMHDDWSCSSQVTEQEGGARGQDLLGIGLVMAVTLHTTHGDLKLEVFCDLVPNNSKNFYLFSHYASHYLSLRIFSLLASLFAHKGENFLALAARGSYDNTHFHRNIKGFMVILPSNYLLAFFTLIWSTILLLRTNRYKVEIQQILAKGERVYMVGNLLGTRFIQI